MSLKYYSWMPSIYRGENDPLVWDFVKISNWGVLISTGEVSLFSTTVYSGYNKGGYNEFSAITKYFESPVIFSSISLLILYAYNEVKLRL